MKIETLIHRFLHPMKYRIVCDGIYAMTVEKWSLAFEATGKISHLGTVVYFSHEEDAMLFLLKYSGTKDAFQ